MPIDALAAILGMAAVTFAIRAAGLLLASRLPRAGFYAAWLQHIPGAVLAALVAPAVARGGSAELIAASAAVAAHLLARNLLVTIGTGVVTVVIARTLAGA